LFPSSMLVPRAACTGSGEERFGSVLDFKNIIGCVQPGVNPFKYNNYGCYCSFGGHGTPVDEVDQCCKVHDEFYGVQMRIPQCRDVGLTSLQDVPAQ
uniref:Phospholipase A2 n=1 Tax=Sparus aurata TaxID=8175 RepID=A0A671U5P3_SPAAU